MWKIASLLSHMEKAAARGSGLLENYLWRGRTNGEEGK